MKKLNKAIWEAEAGLYAQLVSLRPEELPDFLSAHMEELLPGPRPFAEYMRAKFRDKAMSDDPTNVSMLLRYSTMVMQYADTMEKLDAIDESRLSPADDAYYIEVMARIEVKLLEAARYMQ